MTKNPRRPTHSIARLTGLLLGLLLAIVLAYSGIEHLRNPWFFLNAVLRYQLVGGWVAMAVAITVPVFQLVLSAMLLSRTHVRVSGLATGCLLLGFAGVQSVTLARGLKISCGCFGAFSEQLSAWTVGRTAALALVAFLVVLLDWNYPLDPARRVKQSDRI